MKKLLIFGVLLLVVVVVLGCTSTQTEIQTNNTTAVKSMEEMQRSADTSAQMFAQNLNIDNYSAVFDMLLPEIQELTNKTTYIENMGELYYINEYDARVPYNIPLYIFDRVLLENESHGWVYYIFTDGTSLPAVEIFHIDNNWKFNYYIGISKYSGINMCNEIKCYSN